MPPETQQGLEGVVAATTRLSRVDGLAGRLTNKDLLWKNYFPALAANVSTTAIFCSSSCGKPWRSFRYSVLL
jgi:hypothetical protein